jgi:hypothetical protein
VPREVIRDDATMAEIDPAVGSGDVGKPDGRAREGARALAAQPYDPGAWPARVTAEQALSDSASPEGATPWQEVAANLGAVVADEVRRLIDSAERPAEELPRQAVADVSSDHQAVHHTAILVLEQIDAVEARVARLLQQVREEVRQIADEPHTAAQSSPQQALPAEAEPWPVTDVPTEIPDGASSAEEPAEDYANAAIPAPEDLDEAAPPADEAAAVGDEAVTAAEPAAPAADDATPAPSEAGRAPSPAPASRRRGGLFRRRRRGAAALRCAVCGRTPETLGAPRDTKRWRATDDVTLCPDCQAEGWS